MLLMKKRQIIIVALSLMIVIAAYLNWTYTGDLDTTLPVSGQLETEEQETKRYGEAQFVSTGSESIRPETEAAFQKARMDRETARDEAKELLQQVLDRQDGSEEELEKAQQSMTRMANATEQESSLENTIRSKGFADAVVYITENAVTVTVATEGLTPSDTAKIYEAVIAQTGLPAEQIRIMEVK